MGSQKTAVIYARYSSDKQREASIDDQLRVCREWCSRENIAVVREYHDRAMTGRTDARPQFRAMVANAPESDYVVVYAMDRFSRDRFDAPVYKKALADCGVRVLSATENISDTPEGVLMEKILEGQAAFYSLNLARSVNRGMEGNALQCKANGSRLFGYSVDPVTRRYVVNEDEAPLVREVFRRRAQGEPMLDIARDMQVRGVKGAKGKPVGTGWVDHILKNRRYTGTYIWKDIEVPGGMPALVDEATFRACQAIPKARRIGEEEVDEYHLSGKIYCAKCGEPMRGRSGHSGTSGLKYCYYECPTRGCRPLIRKEKLEGAICAAVSAALSDSEAVRRIAERVVAAYGSTDAGAALQACEDSIRANEAAVRNIERGVEAGIVTPGLAARLEELEAEAARLHAERGRLMAETMQLDAEGIAEYLSTAFAAADESLVFDGLVGRVYVMEGFAVAVMNYRDGVNELAEVKVALEKERCEPPEEFASLVSGSPYRIRTGDLRLERAMS